MADPDLQLREGGGGGGGARVSKNFFPALWASVWSKNKGGGQTPPLDPPLITHEPCMQSHVGYVHTVTDK